MAEDQEFFLPPLLARRVIGLLPTRYIGVPSLEIKRQVGVVRPVAVYIFTKMNLTSSGDFIMVKMNFSGIGCLRSIKYGEVFEASVMYLGLDPWRVVREVVGRLPPAATR